MSDSNAWMDEILAKPDYTLQTPEGRRVQWALDNGWIVDNLISGKMCAIYAEDGPPDVNSWAQDVLNDPPKPSAELRALLTDPTPWEKA
jgi:hypothetical protein